MYFLLSHGKHRHIIRYINKKNIYTFHHINLIILKYPANYINYYIISNWNFDNLKLQTISIIILPSLHLTIGFTFLGSLVLKYSYL